MKVLVLLVLSIFLFVKGSENDFVQVSSPSVESELLIRDRRGVLYTTSWLWPKNETIKYGFNETKEWQHTDSEKDWIREMVSEIAENFCINIEERSSGFRDVIFSKTPGCGAVIGWLGRNKTIPISLGNGCHSSVQHEFLHTLGLGHTQRRNDRDDYVTIPESVINGNPQGFAKLYPEHELHLTPPVPYDFKSIMHYSAYESGELAMEPYDLNYIPTMGLRISPAYSDYKMLNVYYKCGDHCPTYASLKCENGGYPHPKVCNKCVCHDFAYGNRCEKLIIKKMSEDYPPIVERVTSNEKSIYANSSIRSDYIQIQPQAFMAPFGRQLKVTIEELIAPIGNMSNNAHCVEECVYRGFEFIDNKEGDLTMGGKLFCCSSRKGESFVTHSNILGFTGHVWIPNTGSITFRVEVHEPRSNESHPTAPVPEWKLPNGDFVDNEPDFVGRTGVPSEQAETLIRDRRAVIDGQAKLWNKNEPIYFGYADETASQFTPSNRASITGRLAEISKATCLKIEEKADGFRGVSIYNHQPLMDNAFGVVVDPPVLFKRTFTGSCTSGGGWPGPNKTQIISLTPGCDTDGIQHEFFHNLGLGHTQQRRDRDDYITIRPNSCGDNCFVKFNTTRDVQLTTPVGYDFKSIMHYGAWDYRLTDAPVIIPKEDIHYIASTGWSVNPVFSDYKQVNTMYKCGDHCADYATLKCENGGYHHPKECGKCVCHDFAFGDRCEKLRMQKMKEDYRDPPFFEDVYNDETSVYANSTIRSDYVQIQPMAFMAPAGRQLLVTIKELDMANGTMTNDEYCVSKCGLHAFEFVDNKKGDLTMGGKMFCCGNRKGEHFITKSNILGYTGHVKKGNKARIVFRVEVYDKRSNATHPQAPEPVWAFPDGHLYQ